MLVRFWGTRGSVPAPGPQTAQYGGNTSCVEVRSGDGTIIILDCGTGVRELGLHLLESKPPVQRVHLLIGHTHWDHIQGFPFFRPAFLPETELNVFAPAGFRRSLEDSLAGQMQYPYFPVKFQDLSSHIHYTELEEGFFRIGDVLVETQYLNHTAPTIAYRLSSAGATVAYVTDHEPFWDAPGPRFTHPGDQRHIEFLRGVDLVIHDAQYTDEEYAEKKGWGHSTVNYATDIALAAGVGTLALFHHDPTHSDAIITDLVGQAQARAANTGSPMTIFAAAEGMQVQVRGKGRPPAANRVSALERRPVQGGRVLLITDSTADIATIEQLLADDGLFVSVVTDAQAAVERAPHLAPDLLIIDASLAGPDTVRLLESIRARSGKPELPVLILTGEQLSGPDSQPVGRRSIDYLAQPFSPPMLSSRVRAWLVRTMTTAVGLEVVAPETMDSGSVAGTGTPAGDTAFLASINLFRQLTTDQTNAMLQHSIKQHYLPGQTIIRQDETGHSVYVLLSGRVRVVEALPDSPVEMFLGELGQGEIFGELGVLRQRPRSATVIALEPSWCLLIPEDAFLMTIHASPEMSLALLRVLAGRIFEADRMLARHAPDPLTGLPGRRAFHDLYRRLAAGARRRNSGVLLIAVDVVHLKAINDRYGYTLGDDVLRTVADALVDSSRVTDLVVRYGSDEFAALLVDAETKDMAQAVERIHERLQSIARQRGLPFPIECRIGYAVSATPPETVDELLRAADEDMQTAKPR